MLIHRNSYVLAGIMAVSGALFWYFSQDPVRTLRMESTSGMYALITLLVYLLSASLAFLLLERTSLFLTASIFSVLPAIYFYGATEAHMAATFIAFLAAWRSFSVALYEREHYTNVSPSIIIQRSLPLFVTALVLVVASSSYLAATGGGYMLTGERILPRAVFNWGITVLESTVLDNIMPGFSNNMSVNEYILRTLESRNATQSLSDTARAPTLREAREELQRKFDVQTTGEENMTDLLYNVTITKSEELLKEYERFVPLAFALAIFLVLKAISLPVVWFITFSVWCILYVLQSLGSIGLNKVRVEKEEMRWT